MNAISCVLRTREEFPKAAEYLQAILKLDNTNGEAWGSLGKLWPQPLEKQQQESHRTAVRILMRRLGHCYLMMDDLQQAYAAYQSAVVNLNSPKVCWLRARAPNCLLLSRC
jgi:glucose repression mediator protein